MPQVLYSAVFSAHGEVRPPSFLAVQGVGMLKLSSGLIRAAKFMVRWFRVL